MPRCAGDVTRTLEKKANARRSLTDLPLLILSFQMKRSNWFLPTPKKITKKDASLNVSLVFPAQIKAGPSRFCWEPAVEEVAEARPRVAVDAINVKDATVLDSRPKRRR